MTQQVRRIIDIQKRLAKARRAYDAAIVRDLKLAREIRSEILELSEELQGEVAV